MLRFSLVLILGALTGIAGWWTLFVQEQVNGIEDRDNKIVALESNLESSRLTNDGLNVDLAGKQEEIAAQDKLIRELRASMYLLKVDNRVGYIEVIDQSPNPENPDEVQTTIRFIELDQDGEPMGEPVEATVKGKKIYIDSLVIKFDDQYVEGGDFLRGSSVVLFRRIFGEHQAPSAGVEIDKAGVHPGAYGAHGDAEGDVYYAELWQKFWDYANDPEAAAERGVRAIHGEAPYIEARPGKRYRVELRASGGLSIHSE